MSRTRLCTAILALALVSACADEAVDDELEPTPEVEVEESAAPAPVTGSMAAGAGLRVDSLEGVGSYLTDGQGRALYMFMEDEPNAGRSVCDEACAQAWPPYSPAGETPAAGAAEVDEGLLGTIEREDGTIQVTYNGWPLYYYAEDTGPGMTTGHDKHDQWGEWYLVEPGGEHLEEEG